MQRRKFIALLGGAAAWPLSATAQTPAIGFLSSRSARDSMKVVAAFGKGLEEVGFAEGKNLSIEYRYADGALDRLPEMAAELVKRAISVLVAVGGSNAAMAAKRASSTMPIVFVIGGDPVRFGREPRASGRQCYGDDDYFSRSGAKTSWVAPGARSECDHPCGSDQSQHP